MTFQLPIKADIDRTLSNLMHEARHRLMIEKNRIMGEAAQAGALRGNRVIVTVAAVADQIHEASMKQAIPILLGFISRMQLPPVEITTWAASTTFASLQSHRKLDKAALEFRCNMSVWVDNEPFPVAIFTAFNAVVTAWHITDWLWQSSKERRQVLANRYKFTYAETDTGIRKGLEKFQNAVVADCRALYVCREIANGSRHMRWKKADPDVKAKAEWHKAWEKVDVVNVGDYVMNMSITDGAETLDPIRWFIDAFGYWEKLFRAEDWITKEKRLPDKIIRVLNATAASGAAPLPTSTSAR